MLHDFFKFIYFCFLVSLFLFSNTIQLSFSGILRHTKHPIIRAFQLICPYLYRWKSVEVRCTNCADSVCRVSIMIPIFAAQLQVCVQSHNIFALKKCRFFTFLALNKCIILSYFALLKYRYITFLMYISIRQRSIYTKSGNPLWVCCYSYWITAFVYRLQQFCKPLVIYLRNVRRQSR